MSSRVRQSGERIRAFVLKEVDAGNGDFINTAIKQFNITRQAVHKHIQKLRNDGVLKNIGMTRSPHYILCPIVEDVFSYEITNKLAEDIVWEKDIKPLIAPLPNNVMGIWSYSFTEMFNNAIDHSDGHIISVKIAKTTLSTEISISDNGVGIFKKIQSELDLIDERLAIFELAKGKLTTDPSNHTGQGIFFTSRMMDTFSIISGELSFNHDVQSRHDWLLERSKPASGTQVWMRLNNHTSRTARRVFDEYSSGDDYAFNKTVVPLSLAKFGPDELVSRSQAKRVLARVNLFTTVIFDFSGISEIGQAFADQIFRVYANQHPEIRLVPINTNNATQNMIARAKSNSGSVV